MMTPQKKTVLNRRFQKRNLAKITRIIKTEGEGIYTATITDQGTNPIYKESVCLAMKLGESSLILSKQFTVMSESAGSDELIVNTGLPIVYVNTAGNKYICPIGRHCGSVTNIFDIRQIYLF